MQILESISTMNTLCRVNSHMYIFSLSVPVKTIPTYLSLKLLHHFHYFQETHWNEVNVCIINHAENITFIDKWSKTEGQLMICINKVSDSCERISLWVGEEQVLETTVCWFRCPDDYISRQSVHYKTGKSYLGILSYVVAVKHCEGTPLDLF